MKLDQYIALDIGRKKTGIARADISGIVVAPVKTIATDDIVVELQILSEDYDIHKLIIGLPKNMDGSEGEQAIYTRSVAEKIRSAFSDYQIIFEDERLSSEAAISALQEEGIRIGQHNKYLVDSYAAAIILRQHLGIYD